MWLEEEGNFTRVFLLCITVWYQMGLNGRVIFYGNISHNGMAVVLLLSVHNTAARDRLHTGGT